MSALQVIWFFLIGGLLIGYAILDGFDLGVGCWYLFTRQDKERRTLLQAIGPVWDGNEVWLLTGGGAIFAAFPHVYATVFSGFYLALMLVLFALIFRAVAVEFRSSAPSPRWRSAWDGAFALGSLLPALLFGVAWGNLLRGVPLDAEMNYTGTFFTLLNPYALLIGLVGLAMFATHGALYLALKTENELAPKAIHWARKAWGTYLGLLILAMAATLLTQPQLAPNYNRMHSLWFLPLGTLAAVILIGVFIRIGQPVKAFIASALSIAGLMAMSGAALFPRLVPALGQREWSLTLMNASSSELTLQTMLILALLGLPFVIGYTLWVYRIFGGKVKWEEEGY